MRAAFHWLSKLVPHVSIGKYGSYLLPDPSESVFPLSKLSLRSTGNWSDSSNEKLCGTQ
jgi:hypothetical protein